MCYDFIGPLLSFFLLRWHFQDRKCNLLSRSQLSENYVRGENLQYTFIWNIFTVLYPSCFSESSTSLCPGLEGQHEEGSQPVGTSVVTSHHLVLTGPATDDNRAGQGWVCRQPLSWPCRFIGRKAFPAKGSYSRRSNTRQDNQVRVSILHLTY